MKLLLDENLSRRIVPMLQADYDPSWGAGPVVVLGEGGVSFRAATACPACLAATTASLPSGAGAPALVWGALAALVAQRLVLRRAEPLGAVTWGPSGLQEIEPVRCPAHTAP